MKKRAKQIVKYRKQIDKLTFEYNNKPTHPEFLDPKLRHNVIVIGPPCEGKSVLIKQLAFE
jgi:hypothetical protein